MTKSRNVLLTAGAEHDLLELHEYIAEFDSSDKADYVLDRLAAAIGQLADLPERGSHPKELRALGIHEYRQIFFKPWRVIYRVTKDRVLVYLIADGRRDMQSLLARRLLNH